ncbi:MAG: membrane protein insertase YidC [Alicyclobacillaceae bacterium]|nr:membrane protein insertase YidC [Alicyclobacillaceae bacterium]
MGKRQKGLIGVLGIVGLFLTGCETSQTSVAPLDRSGWWGTFVGWFSDGIDLFARWTHDYGIAILLVTVIIRLITLPLWLRQMKYAKVMQEMQPQLQKIREKYQGNPQKINEETVKLFQQTGVNPFSGCLPTLIQLPILWALYQAIRSNALLQAHKFLGLVPLGQPDHYFILPILAAVTTYIQSKMMLTGNDRQQQMMLIMMPVMILFIAVSLPSALSLYWVYSNLLTIVQYYFFTKRTRPGVQKETP